MNEAPAETAADGNAPPLAFAEYRRKRKGHVGQWHFLVRRCCYCGAPHSHVTAGVQLSRCMDRPQALYEIVSETEPADPVASKGMK